MCVSMVYIVLINICTMKISARNRCLLNEPIVCKVTSAEYMPSLSYDLTSETKPPFRFHYSFVIKHVVKHSNVLYSYILHIYLFLLQCMFLMSAAANSVYLRETRISSYNVYNTDLDASRNSVIDTKM